MSPKLRTMLYNIEPSLSFFFPFLLKMCLTNNSELVAHALTRGIQGGWIDKNTAWVTSQNCVTCGHMR